MVRVMGNSTERVLIKDLGDVIYYKQYKEYTDQEYEISKDLQTEKKKGRIIIIENNTPIRSSVSDPISDPRPSVGISISDIKQAIREILPEMKSKTDLSGDAIKDAMRSIAPLIAEIVRQEVSRSPVSPATPVNGKPVEFTGPEYIPTVTTEGMKSNIEVKKNEVSGAGVEDSMAALRRLHKK